MQTNSLLPEDGDETWVINARSFPVDEAIYCMLRKKGFQQWIRIRILFQVVSELEGKMVEN